MVSIIVPTFNEENNIKPFLKTLDHIKGNYELIFADGGSTDTTLDLLDGYKVLSTKRGRGPQQNAGAKASRGDILWFLHIDSRFKEDIHLSSLYQSIGISPVGCLSIHFISSAPVMKVCGYMSRKRVDKLNEAFGDQGLFIDRAFFQKIGGFKDIPIMEDYQLSLDLKKIPIKINQIPDKIYTSDRKFKKEGYLKTMYNMQKYRYEYRKGISAQNLDSRYRS